MKTYEAMRENIHEQVHALNEQAWNMRTVSASGMLDLATRALELALSGSDPAGIALSYQNIGRAHHLLSEYPKALENFSIALDINAGTGDRKSFASVQRNIGLVYCSIGQYDPAMSFLLQSLETCREINDGEGMASTLMQTASICTMLDDEEKALGYYMEALLIAEKLEDRHLIAAALSNIGLVYSSRGEYHEAISYQKKALKIKRVLKNQAGIGLALSNLAFVYGQLRQYPQAVRYYRKALAIREQMNDKRGCAIVLNNLGSILSEQGSADEALSCLKSALELAVEAHADDIIYQIYQEYAKACERLGDYKSAYLYHTRYAELKDRFLTEERHRAIASSQMQFEIAQQKIRQFELSQRLKEAEQRTIRAQMNPHFLSNALNSVQYFLVKNEKESALRYMARFGKLIRLTLEHTRKSLISLGDELELIRLYLEMKSLRFAGRFSYGISIDQNLGENEIKVPPMILQPFIENSVRHGIAYLDEDKSGHISVEVQSAGEQYILLIVQDNGIGREKSIEYKSGNERKNRISFGLSLTRERLGLLEEISGKKAELAIIDLRNEDGTAAGTRIEITLPIDLA